MSNKASVCTSIHAFVVLFYSRVNSQVFKLFDDRETPVNQHNDRGSVYLCIANLYDSVKVLSQIYTQCETNNGTDLKHVSLIAF